ncbi:DUF58 domain-containing protein [bacterium]|nr:DUF58 domain-containing protein [bacterium]
MAKKAVQEYTKYLRPEIISKLRNMELRAKLAVEGFLVGLHKSPYHGFSVEFAEYRSYNPGDPVRYIDWKIFAKTDRYYIKEFEEETNLKSYILLDKSGSMEYTSGDITKLEYGSYLAASLAYIMNLQKDAAGLLTFDTQARNWLPPSSTRLRLMEILKQLGELKPGEETNLSTVFNNLAEKIKRRGLVIIISDLFDEPDKLIPAVKLFRHRKNEIIVFHILDPQEKKLGFTSEVIFEDLETEEKLRTMPWQIREGYQKKFMEYINRLKFEFRQSQIDYVQMDTSESFDIALLAYLYKRARMY